MYTYIHTYIHGVCMYKYIYIYVCVCIYVYIGRTYIADLELPAIPPRCLHDHPPKTLLESHGSKHFGAPINEFMEVYCFGGWD